MALVLAAGSAHAYVHSLRASPGDAQAVLEWNGEAAAFSMRYSSDKAALTSSTPPAWEGIPDTEPTHYRHRHTVAGLTNGTRYYFQIRAGDDGDQSNVATTQLAASPTATVEIDRQLRRRVGNTQLALAKLTHLRATGYDVDSSHHRYPPIFDLAGLEYAVNLTSLNLANNEISDVSALANLTELTSLGLSENRISDVSALANLTELETLNLSHNRISDVSVLGNLTKLRLLYLGITLETRPAGNNISDVSALGNLTALEELVLSHNRISDVSALANLTELTSLDLSENRISDVSALGTLTNFNLWSLDLSHNSISDVSALGNLNRNLVSLDLSHNSISDMSLGDMRALESLGLDNNNISSMSLGDMPKLRTLDLSHNSISDVSRLGSLTAFRGLALSHNRISDVSALGNLTNLWSLYLSHNRISDVSALGSLDDLRVLYLPHNRISDVSALGTLTELTSLDLSHNSISDVSALGSLRGLEGLALSDNSISDATALGSLEDLRLLDLSDNSISDVSALGSLVDDLKLLDLSDNSISDVSALGNLAGLFVLDLSDNSISDVSALGNLEGVRFLHLSNNRISDVSGPASRVRASLRLDGNNITDIGPLKERRPHALDLRRNPLSAASIEQLPALRCCSNAEPSDLIGRPATACRDFCSHSGPDSPIGLVAGRQVPLFPSAADPSGRQGFVRVLNRSKTGGEVLIEAVDDTDRRFGYVMLAIGGGEAAHFNSNDLENGNPEKGLSHGVGAPEAGGWRLALSSTLDIEVLAYIRTPDGFLTSVHDVLPREDNGALRAAILNPGSNRAQRSSLRLIEMSLGGLGGYAEINGVDDAGRSARASVAFLSPKEATFEAEWLEDGRDELPRYYCCFRGRPVERPNSIVGGLGDGVGKWRLEIRSSSAIGGSPFYPWSSTYPDRGIPAWWMEAMSLLTNPTGHLTNLSTAPDAGADGVWRVPFFPASGGGLEGFVRIANLGAAGEASVLAVDDGGFSAGEAALRLGARETVHLNSRDLETGNPAKGLPVGVGSPARGDWHLEIASESDIRVTSFVRAADGFLTSMHDVAPVEANVHRVVFFNPASNAEQASRLRLVNHSNAAATVAVTGVDDAGNPGGEVRATVPPRGALTFTGAQLEAGADGVSGALGDGAGKWRLRVESDRPLSVMSLLASPAGYVTNLSTGGDGD